MDIEIHIRFNTEKCLAGLMNSYVVFNMDFEGLYNSTSKLIIPLWWILKLSHITIIGNYYKKFIFALHGESGLSFSSSHFGFINRYCDLIAGF